MNPPELNQMTELERECYDAIRSKGTANACSVAGRIGFKRSSVQRAIVSLEKKGIICRHLGSSRLCEWSIHQNALDELRPDRGFKVKIVNRHRAAQTANATLHGPETCICAAVVAKNGEIIRCHRHSDGFRALRERGLVLKSGPESQGFITTGRFVSREEGRRLQDEAGIPSKLGRGYMLDYLTSEDLY